MDLKCFENIPRDGFSRQLLIRTINGVGEKTASGKIFSPETAEQDNQRGCAFAAGMSYVNDSLKGLTDTLLRSTVANRELRAEIPFPDVRMLPPQRVKIDWNEETLESFRLGFCKELLDTLASGTTFAEITETSVTAVYTE